MSLTSFLKNDGELRILLDQTFPKPSVNIGTVRRADPQTTNYALIGTAFDYLLRFKLEREYSGIDSKPWIAQTGLALAQATDDVDYLEELFADAEDHHEEYLESGELTDDFLARILDLARLDGIYRAGRWADDFGEATDGDLDDLRQLYSIIPEEQFQGADSMLLNPNFGSASKLVGGADADIVLDNTLIDIKTVKEATLKADYWRQLVGYAVLADIAFDELDQMPRFTEFGVYFARHGTLWQTSTEQIYESKKYDQFRDWFESRARNHFSE
jgi:hypothetical protein